MHSVAHRPCKKKQQFSAYFEAKSSYYFYASKIDQLIDFCHACKISNKYTMMFTFKRALANDSFTFDSLIKRTDDAPKVRKIFIYV